MMDFDTILDASRATLFPGTLPTLNLTKRNPSFYQGSCVFHDVILVSSYHPYKENTIRLLSHHSFYGGDIYPRKAEPLFPAVSLKKNTNPPGSPSSSIPLKKSKLNLS